MTVQHEESSEHPIDVDWLGDVKFSLLAVPRDGRPTNMSAGREVMSK